MKTIKSILKLLILTLAFTTVSCDDEPVDPALDLNAGNSSNSLQQRLMVLILLRLKPLEIFLKQH